MVEVGVAAAGVEVEVAVQTALMDREMAAPRSKPENSTRYVLFDTCSLHFKEHVFRNIWRVIYSWRAMPILALFHQGPWIFEA